MIMTVILSSAKTLSKNAFRLSQGSRALNAFVKTADKLTENLQTWEMKPDNLPDDQALLILQWACRSMQLLDYSISQSGDFAEIQPALRRLIPEMQGYLSKVENGKAMLRGLQGTPKEGKLFDSVEEMAEYFGWHWNEEELADAWEDA